MCRDYYLFPRKYGIYYVEFVDKVSGTKLSAKSTGEKDESKAKAKAEFWLLNGLPTGTKGKKKPRPVEEAAGIESIIRIIKKSELNADDALRIVDTLKNLQLIDIVAVKNSGEGAIPFIQFLENFWDFEKSEYIQDQLNHGYRFTRGHAKTCQRLSGTHIKDFFGDKKLNCVTTDNLDKFSKYLANKGLSISTMNSIMHITCKPLRWAYEKKIIPENPCLGLTKFSITNKERGVLTEAETKALFSVKWKDKRAFVASLLAATTGARQGECLALRKSDIGEDTLNILYNYTREDGLKCPKNGQNRIVPLLPVVRSALLDLLKDNPYDVDDPFIFYSLLPDKPCDYKILLKGFKEAMDTVNAEYAEAAKEANLEKPEIFIDYKKRNIVFHSWRHFFCSKITQAIEGEKVAKVSGHLSEKVFKKYADHIETKNIKEVGNAAAVSFSNILKFKKAS